MGDLKLLASHRSVGQMVPFRGEELPIQELANDAFHGVDVAFFSAGASRSKEFAPFALDAGAIVVDNSSAFRMNPEVPLVVPEVNGSTVNPEKKLYSVPNCSAIILLVGVYPLFSLGKVERLIVSTYQSASGGGAGMMKRLLDETRNELGYGEELPPNASFPPYAFNLFSHNTAIDENGQNEEEAKVVQEARKITGLGDLRINVTCVRVPVLRAHTETVTIEFEGKAPELDAVRNCLAGAPGVELVDDREHNQFPTPKLASGKDTVLVGRIRNDLSNPNAISLMVAGDQLLKGAALTGVQIAELAFNLAK